MNEAEGKPKGILTPRGAEFARKVAAGLTQTEAYIKVFKPKQKNRDRLNQQACETAARPVIAAEIARLRAKADTKTILSLNDRYAILAQIAQAKGKQTPALLNAKTRAIEAYNRMSGDQAPERILNEHTGPGGAPLQVAVTADVTTTVTRIPVRERIRILQERRTAEKAERAAQALTP